MEAKETLLEIARELRLNNILDGQNITQDRILLEILKRKSSDINWKEIKHESKLQDFDKFLKQKEDIPHSHLLGQVKVVDEYGGSGQGDDYWLVAYFSKFDTYIRIDGWYNSYDGGELDGDPYIVKPVEKTIVVYEKV